MGHEQNLRGVVRGSCSCAGSRRGTAAGADPSPRLTACRLKPCFLEAVKGISANHARTGACSCLHQVWLATGGDLGGSLRIPASFCGVIGFRASVGRVPHHFSKAVDVKSISGAMARSVPDLALMLDAMVGQHPRWRTPPLAVIRSGCCSFAS